MKPDYGAERRDKDYSSFIEYSVSFRIAVVQMLSYAQAVVMAKKRSGWADKAALIDSTPFLQMEAGAKIMI